MAEPSPADAALPRGYQVAATIVTPLPAEYGYPLKNRDFLTLCDGTNGEERAGRDLHLGFFLSALVGVGGLLSCVDFPTAFAQGKWVPLIFLSVLVIIAAATGGMCALHWIRMEKEDTPYTRLTKEISDFFQALAPTTNSKG